MEPARAGLPECEDSDTRRLPSSCRNTEKRSSVAVDTGHRRYDKGRLDYTPIVPNILVPVLYNNAGAWFRVCCASSTGLLGTVCSDLGLTASLHCNAEFVSSGLSRACFHVTGLELDVQLGALLLEPKSLQRLEAIRDLRLALDVLPSEHLRNVLWSVGRGFAAS